MAATRTSARRACVRSSNRALRATSSRHTAVVTRQPPGVRSVGAAPPVDTYDMVTEGGTGMVTESDVQMVTESAP